MKQKYRILKNEKDNELLIQEYAVLTAESRKQKHPGLENEDFSLLCEQTYPSAEVKKATAQGKDELILFLRNRHFFPIGVYMNQIADTVTDMYATKGERQEDLIFDDKEVLLGLLPGTDDDDITDIDGVEDDDDSEDSVDDIDDLLDDDSQIAKGKAGSIKHEQFDEDEDEEDEY